MPDAVVSRLKGYLVASMLADPLPFPQPWRVLQNRVAKRVMNEPLFVGLEVLFDDPTSLAGTHGVPNLDQEAHRANLELPLLEPLPVLFPEEAIAVHKLENLLRGRFHRREVAE